MRSYFHLPVALFGARTALSGKWRLREFWPTRGRLRHGDAIILDASPIVDGYLVDTSFSTRLGDNAVHQRIRSLGYENRHQEHLETVLGHRAVRIRRPRPR